MAMQTIESEFDPELTQSRWTDSLKRGVWPRPRIYWIGLVYMAVCLIRPWELLIPELADFRFERVTGILMFVLLLVAYKCELRGGATSLAAIGFVFTMWLTSLFAFRRDLCEPDLNRVVATLISFFVLLFIVRSTYQFYFMLASYIGIMGVYLSKAQWEYFLHGAGKFQMGVRRLAGIELSYGHPNALGSCVICSLPIAVFLYRIRDDLTSTWPNRHRRLFLWCMRTYFAVAVTSVFLTRSRTAIVCLVAFLLMLALSSGKTLTKVKRVAVVAVLTLVTFFALPNDMRGRIQTMWDSSVEKGGDHQGAHTSTMGRYYGFMQGMKMFERYPLTGVGLANYKEYREERLDGIYLDAHNLIAEVLSETGVLGAVSFAFLIAVVCRNLLSVRRRTKRNPHPDARALNLLALCCMQILALLLLQGITAHNLHSYNWFWLAAFSAIAYRLSSSVPIQESPDVQGGYDVDDFENEPQLAASV